MTTPARSGVFDTVTDRRVEEFTESVSFDRRLYAHDIRGSIAHAEMLAIRAAARALDSERLAGCDLYVTLEPCAMCAQAIALARIRRLYFAAPDTKGGGVEHGARVFDQPTCNHRPEIYGGIDEARAAALLKDFFAGKR